MLVDPDATSLNTGVTGGNSSSSSPSSSTGDSATPGTDANNSANLGQLHHIFVRHVTSATNRALVTILTMLSSRCSFLIALQSFRLLGQGRYFVTNYMP